MGIKGKGIRTLFIFYNNLAYFFCFRNDEEEILEKEKVFLRMLKFFYNKNKVVVLKGIRNKGKH